MVAEQIDGARTGPIDCPVLLTERLVLRRPHREDPAHLVLLANNRRCAELRAGMPHPYGAAEGAGFLERSADPQRGGAVYALTLADSGAFVGCAGLTAAGSGYSLGYWVGEPHWGQGYATEAAHALIDLAFRATDADAVEAACRVSNAASRRVIHKCGFQYAGQGMMTFLAAGQVPVERYRLDRPTWIGLRSWSMNEACISA